MHLGASSEGALQHRGASAEGYCSIAHRRGGMAPLRVHCSIVYAPSQHGSTQDSPRQPTQNGPAPGRRPHRDPIGRPPSPRRPMAQ
eukprot:5047807-Pyramimonas_sp.AAC.1